MPKKSSAVDKGDPTATGCWYYRRYHGKCSMCTVYRWCSTRRGKSIPVFVDERSKDDVHN